MSYFNAIKVSDMFKLKIHLQIHNKKWRGHGVYTKRER